MSELEVCLIRLIEVNHSDMKVVIKLNERGKSLLGVDSLEINDVVSIRSHKHKIVWKSK